MKKPFTFHGLPRTMHDLLPVHRVAAAHGECTVHGEWKMVNDNTRGFTA